MGHLENALPVLIAALELDDQSAVLHATRAIELLGREAKAAVPAMEKVPARAKKLNAPGTLPEPGKPDMAMFIRFSAQAFADKVGPAGGKDASPAE